MVICFQTYFKLLLLKKFHIVIIVAFCACIHKFVLVGMTRLEIYMFLFVMGFSEGSVAGAAAGVIVEAVLYPIDTIKTRLQACSIC